MAHRVPQSGTHPSGALPRGTLAPVHLSGGRGVAFDVARGLTAAAVLLSAAVHLDLWALEGFAQVRVIGDLFLLNAVGGLAIAVLTLAWRHWLPLVACVGFGALTLAAFWLAVLAGLFGFRESATGVAQAVTLGAEIAAVLIGMAALGVLGMHERGNRHRKEMTGRGNAPDQ